MRMTPIDYRNVKDFGIEQNGVAFEPVAIMRDGSTVVLEGGPFFNQDDAMEVAMDHLGKCIDFVEGK